MAIAILNAARLRDILHYEPLTGVFTWRQSRRGVIAGSTAGCVASYGYQRIIIDGTSYRAHRLAWLYVYSEFPNLYIDHIDRNRTNNRVSNLRICDSAKNQQNQGLHLNNTSGFPGVTFVKERSKWKAQIMLDRKNYWLGNFDKFEDAVEARRLAKEKFHAFGADKGVVWSPTSLGINQ